MWECEWQNFYKTDVFVKDHMREAFLYKRSLCQDQILDKIKTRALYGSMQCDIKVPDHRRENFDNFRPFFKNTKVCREDI